ncbi:MULTISPECIES: hypothetical protein [Streptomyces]|uniref:Uncharacterized protein n=2 Tax=Streptomyces avermitilis TaxID=33903 RepID=Q82RI6_STRAW|nr:MULTISPECIES: hypothetical protein [Streptomyces]MYS95871.1 hypothetical protein [Streptomyces sp. SID5469]BAC67866.1 hypothetical protein SAVERM_157 [Streptomyces avermitilis MA-4680 = NBRC 14893]BBJ47556.1 hypothetical protein SAVMC3_01850 [Streptomyces avermitilis]GDY70063.1 hypothetical protein SAV14893_094560 [Streptomyces avermitilis]GDY80340.1 hypothetical protein SAV31267_098250 [Streptomyces avermitilis]
MTQPDRILSDPCGTIVDMVARVEPDLTVEQIRDAVKQAAPSRTARRSLAKTLTADPALLTSRRPEGSRSVERLIHKLLAHGARQVAVPLCAGCGKPEPLPQRRGKLRVCAYCDATARAQQQPCADCGLPRVIRYTGRNGEGLCSSCQPKDNIDWAQRICDHIATVDPTVPAETVRQIITTITRGRPHYVRRLAWDLEDRPGMLTGNAGHGTPKVIALIDALRDAGAQAIVRPPCPHCGRTSVTLRNTLGDVRVCPTCYNTRKAVNCSRCKRRSPVARRSPDGQSICNHCDRTDPINHEECSGCGRLRPIIRRNSPTGPLCDTCYRPPVAICLLCGHARPCFGVAGGMPRCENCTRLREPCLDCGRTMPVKARTANGPLCETCFKKNPVSFKACTRCGTVERLRHHGLCHRCACNEELTALLAGPDGAVAAPLMQLHSTLMASNHVRVLDWLQKRNTAVSVLREIATAECSLDHESLDARTDKAVEHLRAILVAAGALPRRDEQLVAAERWIAAAVAAIADLSDRHTIQAFATWTHLTRLRKYSRRKPITAGQAVSARRSVKAAVGFLAWLRAEGLNLEAVGQRDLDRWLEGGPTTRQYARDLVLWAVRTKRATNISIPARLKNSPTQALDEDERREIAHRLLGDDQLDARDRVAGLLSLLYAQPFSVIIRLTADHVVVREKSVLLRLGKEPLELSPELGNLIQQIAADRRRDGQIGQIDAHWLFPGIRPGQHLSHITLAARLKRLGIRSLPSRTAAIRDLTAEVPAAVVNRLLGLSTSTATSWAKRTAKTSYAAEIARRSDSDK